MYEIKKDEKTGCYYITSVFYDRYQDEYVYNDHRKLFKNELDAHQYAIEYLGAYQCAFCNKIATNHYNASGGHIMFGSPEFHHDYFTCDEHGDQYLMNFIREDHKRRMRQIEINARK